MDKILDMCSGKYETGSLADAGYGVEVMCANWNPAAEMMRLEQAPVAAVKRQFPAHPEIDDIDAFLRKMYAFQS